MPEDMFARMLVALGLVLAMLGGITWLLKKYGTRLGLPMAIRNGKSRLAMVETTVLDARHRLVLIKRDETEHLLILGGTQPVIIETGIMPNVTTQQTK